MELDNIFDEMSFFGELEMDNMNIEQLKQYGNVTNIKKEKDNLITEIIEFKSFDGKLSFSKVFSYPKDEERIVRMLQIDEELRVALENEEYELAQILTDEKNILFKEVNL